MREKIGNISIFYKMAGLFVVCIMLATSLCMWISGRDSIQLLEQKETELGKEQLSQMSEYLDGKYNMFYNVLNYVHSSNLSEIMSRINENAEASRDYSNIRDINAFFRGISSADEDISDVILVTREGTVFSYSSEFYPKVKPNYDFSRDPLFQKLDVAKEQICIGVENPSSYTLKERKRVLSFAGKIYNARCFPERIEVGTLLINVPLDCLDDLFAKNASTGHGMIEICNAEGELLYSTGQSKGEQALYEETQGIGTSGLTARYSLGRNAFAEQHRQIILKAVFVVASSCILTIGCTLFLVRKYRRKMEELMQAMQKLQQGDFQSRVTVQSRDEIGRIALAFNHMCDELNTYVQLAYSSELQRKDAEMKALQAQINPHFLFNTLESIKSHAMEKNDMETADMICLLGNLFRWSSQFDQKTVYLEDEMDYCKSYLELMNYRYQGAFDVNFTIPEELLDYGVPKLILQPIIENTIKHGFKEKTGKRIVGIIAKQKQQVLEITVYDNGEGISRENLSEIQTKLKSGRVYEQDSIGIYNVNYRIQLLFGDAYGVKIESNEHIGTAVKLRMPAMPKKEMERCV